MDAIGLGLLATLIGGIGLLLWQRRRRQRRQVTHHRLRCPIHGDPAEVAVATDPAVPSSRQYVGVARCSLLSDTAIGLPGRVTYLWDAPPCKVRLDPARSFPVYSAEVSCPQPCVFVLNAAAVSGPRPAQECTSGASDAIALAEQAVGNPRISRLLWEASL